MNWPGSCWLFTERIGPGAKRLCNQSSRLWYKKHKFLGTGQLYFTLWCSVCVVATIVSVWDCELGYNLTQILTLTHPRLLEGIFGGQRGCAPNGRMATNIAHTRIQGKHFIRCYAGDLHTKINVQHWELNPDLVTHPSTNWALHRLTSRRLISLIETNMLPLYQIQITTRVISLCYSLAEYCCPLWARYCHTHRIDSELHNSMSLISGCLQPTHIHRLPVLANTAPPHLCSKAATDNMICKISAPTWPVCTCQCIRAPCSTACISMSSFIWHQQWNEDWTSPRWLLWSTMYLLQNLMSDSQDVSASLPCYSWPLLNCFHTG